MKKEDRTVSFEALQRQKRRARARDERRLASGEVTPEQLQAENSFIPEGTPIEIVDLAGYLRSRRSR
jgi:hypothetical protein